LADDAHTTSPPWGAVESRAASPSVPDSRVESPPHVIEAVGTAFAGDIGATTPPGVIDIDPINARPTEDLVQDQPQIDQGPTGPRTSSVQVPPIFKPEIATS
jgi:hypothetical protein